MKKLLLIYLSFCLLLVSACSSGGKKFIGEWYPITSQSPHPVFVSYKSISISSNGELYNVTIDFKKDFTSGQQNINAKFENDALILINPLNFPGAITLNDDKLHYDDIDFEKK